MSHLYENVILHQDRCLPETHMADGMVDVGYNDKKDSQNHHHKTMLHVKENATTQGNAHRHSKDLQLGAPPRRHSSHRSSWTSLYSSTDTLDTFASFNDYGSYSSFANLNANVNVVANINANRNEGHDDSIVSSSQSLNYTSTNTKNRMDQQQDENHDTATSMPVSTLTRTLTLTDPPLALNDSFQDWGNPSINTLTYITATKTVGYNGKTCDFDDDGTHHRNVGSIIAKGRGSVSRSGSGSGSGTSSTSTSNGKRSSSGSVSSSILRASTLPFRSLATTIEIEEETSFSASSRSTENKHDAENDHVPSSPSEEQQEQKQEQDQHQHQHQHQQRPALGQVSMDFEALLLFDDDENDEENGHELHDHSITASSNVTHPSWGTTSSITLASCFLDDTATINSINSNSAKTKTICSDNKIDAGMNSLRFSALDYGSKNNQGRQQQRSRRNNHNQMSGLEAIKTQRCFQQSNNHNNHNNTNPAMVKHKRVNPSQQPCAKPMRSSSYHSNSNSQLISHALRKENNDDNNDNDRGKTSKEDSDQERPLIASDQECNLTTAVTAISKSSHLTTFSRSNSLNPCRKPVRKRSSESNEQDGDDEGKV